MRKRRVWIVLGAFALVLLSACVVQVYVTGDVYIQYGWDTGVWDVADTNPAFQYVTAENQPYLSEIGTYYASYKTLYGGYYIFNYTLTAEYASSYDPYGPLNTYFYLYLANSGPIISDPVIYGRALSDTADSAKLLNKSAGLTPSIFATRSNLGEPSGISEKKVNGYTLHLEYWKVARFE
ncbi:MAG: hypothetical protein RBT73_00145 [Spirochaetia bacterium]|jgi:hypothetical protein|nr:hypothetical protein [Spirochaetia bacterium]